MFIETVSLPEYNCKVKVIIGKSIDIDKEIRRLCEKYKIKCGKEDNDAACVITTYTNKLYYVLYSSEYLSVKYFFHEIGHLAAFIFNHRKKRIKGTSEPFAVLCGELADKFQKILNKHKIKLYSART